MLYLSQSVDEELDGRPLLRVLRQRMHLPAGYISHLKFIPDGICLNGTAAHVDAAVRCGDTVRVRIDDVGERNPFRPQDVPGAAVLWEDEYLAVVNKPAGVAVHGTDAQNRPCLANWAAYRWGPEQVFHPVSRLDRGTSGLLCLAKCGLIHDRLRRALHTEALERVYYAVCEGELAPGAGVIDAPIAREGRSYAVRGDGKPSVTEYERIAAGGGVSLVRLKLHTGRTHQIRIHMASVGHPLCGDVRYGGGCELDRPALHSMLLRFSHPVTGQEMQFRQALPPDMERLVTEKTCLLAEIVLKYI